MMSAEAGRPINAHRHHWRGHDEPLSHLKSIVAYGATVAAVHDINLASARKLAEEAGVECATNGLAHFFDRELDGVVIATPPPARVEPVTRACARGIHLMIEKPPSLTMADGRDCLEQIAFDLEAVGPHLRLHANLTERRIRGYLNGQDIDEPAPAENALGLDKTGAWLCVIETGDRSLVRSDFRDALNTLALVEAATRSLPEDRLVPVSEV